MSRLQELVYEARRLVNEGPILIEAARTPEARIHRGHGLRLPGQIAAESFMRGAAGTKAAEGSIRGSRLLKSVQFLVVPPRSTAIGGLMPLLQRCEHRQRAALALSTAYSDELLEALRAHNATGKPAAAFVVADETLSAFQDASPEFEAYTGSLGAGGIAPGWDFERVEIREHELLLFDSSYIHLPPAARLVIGVNDQQSTEEACRRLRDMVDQRTLSSRHRAVDKPLE